MLQSTNAPCERYGHRCAVARALCGSLAGSAVRSAHHMYVFGGCDAQGRFLDDLYVFNLQDGTWQCLGGTGTAVPGGGGGGDDWVWPKGRHFHACAMVGRVGGSRAWFLTRASCKVDDRFMYVLFGKSNGYLNDVHRWNLAAGRWERLECRLFGGALPGRRLTARCDNTEEAATHSRIPASATATRWCSTAVRLFAQSSSCCGAQCFEKGDLYVYGGFDDFGLRCNDLWQYSHKTNTWTLITTLQVVWSGVSGNVSHTHTPFSERRVA